MTSRPRINRIEYLVYGVFMLLIIIGPTLSTLFHGHEIDDTKFLLNDLMHTIKVVAVYIIAFIIHDIIIAPLLVHKHKPWLYFLGVVALGAVFMLYQCNNRPADPLPPKIENSQQPAAPPPEIAPGKSAPAAPPPEIAPGKSAPVAPPLFRRHDILAMIMFLFGIGTNIGVKFYFRSIIARKEIEDLEKENLNQNLLQLRYQLHPHFFMNTLNNIHALVDIDPKKAQQCIIDLSKLMRYVLYESNHEFVQASREIEFMANYVSLTRIRYSDKLTFTVDSPDDGTQVWIPPLIFVSFVENAFKHGVSYNKESFINITDKIYDGEDGKPRMYWTCHNSKRKRKSNDDSKKKVAEASGIGLSNIRQRLDLMFGTNYTLNITDGTDDYLVEMDIPVFNSDPSTNATHNA